MRPEHGARRVRAAAALLLCLALPSVSAGADTSSKRLSGKRVSLLAAHTHTGAAEALAKWFNEETGATVKIIGVDYWRLLQAAMDDHERVKPRIDVMMMFYVHLGHLVEAGVLTDLEEIYTRRRAEIQPEDFIPGILEGHTVYQGRRWALPFDGDTHVLFFRRSVFAKHGLTPPVTWDEFAATAKRITEREQHNGMYGTAIMAHPNPELIVSTFMNRLAGFGGSLTDNAGVPVVDRPEAVAALEAMIEHSDHALPTPLETDFSVARDAFLLGHVAMVEQWADIGVMAEDPEQSLVGGDWGAVPTPSATGQPARTSLNAGFTLGLSSRAPHRHVAEEFLVFTARPDISLRLNLIPGGGGMNPTRKSVLEASAYRDFTPIVSRVQAASVTGELLVWPKHPDMPELLSFLAESLVAAVARRLSPQAALSSCQKKWTTIIARRRNSQPAPPKSGDDGRGTQRAPPRP